jgi:autotransporter-associated beta strand protein
LTALAGASNIVNISALPVVPTFPSQISLIKYAASTGDLTTFGLGTLPSTFQGYISNNVTASSIDLVLTNGPTPPPAAKPVVWDGEVSGDWDTTTANWSNSGNLTNYNNLTIANGGDPVTFNDTLLGTTNVNLTQTLSPVSVTINNTLSNYVFTGSGKISGGASVSKSGSGSATMANSSGSDFTGGVTVSGGSLTFANSGANAFAGGATVNGGSLIFANSGANNFSGGVTINGGTVQFGNGTTAGALPASATYLDNGSAMALPPERCRPRRLIWTTVRSYSITATLSPSAQPFPVPVRYRKSGPAL